MPVLDPELIGRGLNEITHQLARRDVDHRVLETLAVAATCIFGVGGYIYWAMKQK
ncbi:hypothetical protein PFICI_14489 [Pestalotiopsis fici W106-1]|uniref:Uncharacterized protein n=1 Tax=Pestalotiopsis fici (strain W106-1 / CGMCC3.15140) TaxID=1229662 RepID=W3WI26_PESFW|nr:uncharacterized protein PFICI_14489 [Pestalotiopsis fici W106-1]ETS73543.1 hypothetical protein PFICI_14489 [Pestalotiopsis fici W106-1]